MPNPLPLVFDAPRRAKPPRHFADLDATARAAAVAELGLPAFRAKQLATQYYGRLTADPQQMTDLPAAVREQVAEALFPDLLTAVREIETDAGETRKVLWRAVDGTTFESVLMRYSDRNTVCISSQAGCGMACPFCATGQGGLQRNLSTAEILEQVRAAAVELRDRDGEGIAPAARGGRLSNIVFMGMGEPLANYNRVIAAVRRIVAPPPDGFGISARSVTVSTVGLAPAIRKLADERLNVTLALSLHAPDDELRDTLVPVNNRWKVSEALDAARYYADVTGRRVSIEYALIRDVNDQPWRADLLGKRLHGALGPLVHVNVIPLNPTPGSEWDASPKPAEREFVRRVRERGVSCTVRDTRGREIAAACGQLAAEG
ncbi:23S rRNA (adenine(2503)-C(2))-methyltransferase RlmN [Mycolicibacterium monacense]|uniref:Probable dual-specificity RNA methyltransferase RlmN n=4 Tax=Mycobacteriaceae TaxID=1762 RepID=RLMN_MYCSJ|nr:23S rRNA (adenine(2503)-C(2))-methyltransferase RlmN [Mycolicibacterium monacense]A1UEJ3.1 RecName: Full=Probable dual-specificity RNA methyltransferase RlmN; AltName: Full=23S rRNA (adenine(2503)-C(2))-methyltransferase; AltName: Full=23S rRNA m2A2503 methyltransferase; AltName: Full=Ribosomal RNA large subunit methyltransferase N; AltName: Full=tRNA (adenine(37)-C(2))-methyltransferase; AltName: Full=tRNA m2A37 methyltransferase [Mycobacterium sp. KMS]A3PXZ7.1 RecName: Full=Probable dual-spe